MKKKKQKNKRWVQVYSTTIRNVALKVNFCTNHKTNITSLNGYLIDVKTRIRHDADVSVSTSVQDARDKRYRPAVPTQDAGGILAQAYPELFSVVLHEG